ncbi:MAG: hypothetical protein H5U07_05630 [Candidatus Aminicenantes bacterium]|nr:hypothetical protein [Candidatus Aminicenantes bacterium]
MINLSPPQSRARKAYKKPVLLFLLILTHLSLFFSCSSPTKNPEGQLLRFSGCKNFGQNESLDKGHIYSAAEECAEYFYDGRGILKLKHLNAAFNCCPGTISAQIIIEPGEIFIKEQESASICDCNCLFDVDYEIIHLKPGVYRISIKNPYQPSDEPPLEFFVNLEGPTSGTYCVPRKKYPWF